jgi:dienelactone hydrolase
MSALAKTILIEREKNAQAPKFISFSIVLIFIVLLGNFACSENHRDNNVVNYEKLGDYTPQTYISKDKKGKLKYVSYYPKEGVESEMPVVLFIKGGGDLNIYSYSGIMKFLASKGYYVIGVDTNSYSSSYVMKYLEKALDEIKKKNNLTLSKLAVMGHSLGGGQLFYVMNALQKKGYAKRGSLAVSIDGWFAFEMNEEDLMEIKGRVAFIQMNGLKGTGTDPRINLKIWNLLKNAKKSFYTLPSKNHNYITGKLADILQKKDLLFIIGALSHDAFNNSNEGILQIPHQNRVNYEDILNALEAQSSYRGGDCKGLQYRAIDVIKNNNIDYCTLE